MRKLLLLFLFLCGNVWAAGVSGLSYTTYAAGGATPSYTQDASGNITNRTALSLGVVSTINFNWGGGNVLTSGRGDGVIIRFYGYINIATAGTYYFGGNADDGIRIKVNGTSVINSWQEDGGSFRQSSALTMSAGVYPIELMYYENGGGALVNLQWYTNGTWSIVPSTALATASSYFGPTVTGTGSGTVITTTTSGSTVYTYSQPVIITYYSNGTTSTANNGSATLLSTTTTGSSSGASNNQQAAVSSARTQQATLPITSHIYIDQIGSGDRVIIKENNNYNLIGGQSQTGLKLRGGNNNLTINQGDPTNTASTHNVVGVDLLGGSNTLKINQGTDANGNGVGTDTGYNYSSVYVNGVNNSVSLQQSNNSNTVGNYASISVTGNQNNQSVIQTGTGAKQFFSTVNGNQNTISATQDGLGEHFLDINLSGNGNSATVSQTGSTADSAQINLINAGGPASVNLTQTGGQSYSITQTCVQVGGCAAVVVRQGQ